MKNLRRVTVNIEGRCSNHFLHPAKKPIEDVDYREFQEDLIKSLDTQISRFHIRAEELHFQNFDGDILEAIYKVANVSR